MDQQITAVIINRKEHKLVVGNQFAPIRQLPPEAGGLMASCPCHAEGLRLPPGPADGRGDACGVLHHGAAVVCRSHGSVHQSRQQPEAGVGELGPGRAATFPGHQRAEVDGPGHLLAHGLLCVHYRSPAGLSDAAPLWLEHRSNSLLDVHFSFSQFIPMPVLYGVFLYMGASSLKGIQVNHHGNKRNVLNVLASYLIFFPLDADKNILLLCSCSVL